jgi:hypothetical protein
MKRAIIIQGPTNKKYVSENKECWKDNSIIFSTWVDSDKSAYDLEKDIVLFNEYPKSSIPCNWPLQRISTLNGIKLAKELGFDRVLKWRSDLKTNNAEELLNLFQLDKINFYAFMNHREGYFTDFFIEGGVNEMIDLFNTTKTEDYPEKILTNQMFELNLQNKSNFICKLLTEEVDIYWNRLNYWMHVNKNHNEYLDKIKTL